MKKDVYYEFYGAQVKEADLIDTAKKIWKDLGNKAADLKKLDIYIKPEDGKAYYCEFVMTRAYSMSAAMQYNWKTKNSDPTGRWINCTDFCLSVNNPV